MRGFLLAGGILIALEVFLQPNSASKLTSGGNIVTAALHQFMSPNTPGIPNIAPVESNVHTLAPGPNQGTVVPPSSGPVATPQPVIV